ncbi:hypothetical protein EIP91_010706 [Steccherinum ochraceum]|uniref:JmjC domain-containing protein n=1 Tax=Steccherinum ochraceum TaxID=92696 RepID=A0A4R0R861_9APHY|nr:hypothetical protein EIP91_010706 [Steccherinum ochraceum]
MEFVFDLATGDAKPNKPRGQGANQKQDLTKLAPKEREAAEKKREYTRLAKRRERHRKKAANTQPLQAPAPLASVDRGQGGFDDAFAPQPDDPMSVDFLPEVPSVDREQFGSQEASGSGWNRGEQADEVHPRPVQGNPGSPLEGPPTRTVRNASHRSARSSSKVPVASTSRPGSTPYAFSATSAEGSSNLVDVASRSRYTTTHDQSPFMTPDLSNSMLFGGPTPAPLTPKYTGDGYLPDVGYHSDAHSDAGPGMSFSPSYGGFPEPDHPMESRPPSPDDVHVPIPTSFAAFHATDPTTSAVPMQLSPLPAHSSPESSLPPSQFEAPSQPLPGSTSAVLASDPTSGPVPVQLEPAPSRSTPEPPIPPVPVEATDQPAESADPNPSGQPPRWRKPLPPALREDPTLGLPDRPKDLRTWEGKAYKPDARDVYWRDGTITKAPYQVADPNAKKRTNKLQHDEDHLVKLADDALPAQTHCPWFRLIFYDEAKEPAELADEITRFQARGGTCHLIGFPPMFAAKYLKWSLPVFQSRLNVSASQPFEAQDAEARTRNADNTEKTSIHSTRLMADFLDDVNERPYTVTRAILDAPALRSNAPQFVGQMDDSHAAFLSNLVGDPYRRSMPLDVAKSESWLLVHTGGFHTYTHNDSEGLGTHVRNVSGVKGWVFSRHPKIQAARNQKQYHAACDNMKAYTVDFPEDLERYVVWLHPGDILIQGPGQYHEVYTPIPTVTVGGHFYSLNTMHLSETVLYYTHGVHATDTNHRHHSASLVAALMINRLKDKGPRSYPKKSLMGLCNLILHPEAYHLHRYRDPDLYFRRAMESYAAEKAHVDPPTEVDDMDDIKQARANARILQTALGFEFNWRKTNRGDDYSNYAFAGEGLYDPGPDVFLSAELLDQLNALIEPRPDVHAYDSTEYATWHAASARDHPFDTDSDAESTASSPAQGSAVPLLPLRVPSSLPPDSDADDDEDDIPLSSFLRPKKRRRLDKSKTSPPPSRSSTTLTTQAQHSAGGDARSARADGSEGDDESSPLSEVTSDEDMKSAPSSDASYKASEPSEEE